MWLWKCIVCKKDLTPETNDAGSDDQAYLPNLAGGTIKIDFGFGSRFDDVNIHEGTVVQHQACICDECYETHMELTRPVITIHTKKWKILNSDYRYKTRT